MKTLLVVAMMSACALGQGPTYKKDSPVVTIPYAGAHDFSNLTGTLGVRLAFNGGAAHRFAIDTGSVGIVVPAQEIQGFDGKGEPDSMTYSSSGLKLEGVRVWVDVSFPDAVAPGGKPVVAHVPVLAVTQRTCTGKGVNAAMCDPDGSAHMMGVGFGRGAAAAETQRKNALVMLNAMQEGRMRRGFVLSRQGVQLGLNEATTQGFVWQKLEARGDTERGPKDYETAPGSFEIDGKRSPAGTILMDTGLTNMMLADPDERQTGEVKAGAKVRIKLLGGQLHYDFVVAGDGAMVPRRVSSVRASHGVFVNTGLRVFALYDYLYDGESGYLGLRPIQ